MTVNLAKSPVVPPHTVRLSKPGKPTGAVVSLVKAVLVAVVALVALNATLGSTTPAPDATPVASDTAKPKPPANPRWMTRPCKSEGDVNCFWNAKTMGNGQGRSYFVRQVPGSTGLVCVFYPSKPRLDYCS